MSVTVAQSPPPPPQAQAQPLPEPEEPSTQQLDEDPNVQSAVRFLQDARVRNSQVESQIRFLKGKNMSDAQIRHALAKVGRVVTAEKIASVRTPAPMNGSFRGQPAAGAMASPSPSRPFAPVGLAPSQPQYSQTLFPRAPPPPQEETQAKGVDWRDVVIGTGAAIIAGVTGYKLFNRYSPYEIRRKTDRRPSRAIRGPAGGRQRLPLRGSSDSEADCAAPSSQRAAFPLPPPPTATPPAAGPTALPAAAADAEELKKVQAQLEETKEALTNERKKCADLAVGSAKIRAEKQQLSRANDRLTQQVETLKKDVEKLEAAKAAAAAAGEGEKLTATEEEPAKPFFPSLTVDAERTRAAGEPVAVPTLPAPTLAGPTPAEIVEAAATAAAVAPAESPAPVAAAPTVVAPQPPAAPAQPAVVAAPAPAVEVTPLPVAVPDVVDAGATAVPPAGLPAPAAAVVIPPAFLTPDPIKPEEAGAAPAPSN